METREAQQPYLLVTEGKKNARARSIGTIDVPTVPRYTAVPLSGGGPTKCNGGRGRKAKDEEGRQSRPAHKTNRYQNTKK